MVNGEAFGKEALALTGDELSRSQPQGVRGAMPETDDVRIVGCLEEGGLTKTEGFRALRRYTLAMLQNRNKKYEYLIRFLELIAESSFVAIGIPVRPCLNGKIKMAAVW